jgi:leader peptidase (prepilin peptidase) / N-methyltransferase
VVVFVLPRPHVHAAVPVVVLALAVATFVAQGHDADALAWAGVQLVLGAIAAIDAATRRIPNVATLATALCAAALRLAFARRVLPETLVASATCFVVFLVLALAARGGLGMGDVKLAALLGLLLGRNVLAALLLGTIAGAVAALVAARRSGSRKATLAYGPYLCLGAAVVILFTTPPALA